MRNIFTWCQTKLRDSKLFQKIKPIWAMLAMATILLGVLVWKLLSFGVLDWVLLVMVGAIVYVFYYKFLNKNISDE